MFKKIKTTRLGITEQTVVFDEIADLIEANDTYSEYYKTNFVRTEIQQKAKDIITYSELPPGEVLHLLMYGSVGSGKTWNALSIVCDTLTDHPGSTALFVRRTYNEIKDALYKPTERFLDQFNLGCRPLKTPPSIHLHNGSEFRFRSAEKTASSGSDKADDLGGTAFSIAVIDEADEVPEEYAKTVAGRMREKTGVQKKVIIYICNPPSEDHWLYEWFFENSDPEDPKSKYRAIRMPIEGNREHLPEGYIESVHKDYAHNPALYLRMVRGEFGPAVKGFPIFSKFFERERHVATVPIAENWNDKYPLQRCWDFGWNRPACVVFQDDLDSGQIRIYRAFLGSKIILEAFRNQMLNLCETAFPGAQWEDFCYDDQTEVLTHRGWKYFKDVSLKDKLATISRDRRLEFHLPSKLHSKEYSGEMITYSTLRGDLSVTPGHRMAYYIAKSKEVGIKSIEQVLSTSELRAPANSTFTAPTELDPWSAFVGFYTADGCMNGNRAQFCLKKERKLSFLESLCSQLGFNYKKYSRKDGGQLVQIYLSPGRVEFLKSISKPKTLRYIWEESLCLYSVFSGLMEGDGSWDTRGHSGHFDTSVKEVADDFQALLQMVGMSGNVVTRQVDGVYKGNCTMHRVSVTRRSCLVFPRANFSSQQYTGTVYCATVPNGTLYVRRNGKALWCGNCDPAGVQKTDKTHLTSLDILKAAGLKVRYRASSIEYGLSILSELLSSTIPYKHGPRPAILLDPSCGILADAFEMGYCADMDFDETSKQTIKVVKDGYYEHVVDALRYGLIHKRRPNGLRKADYTGGNSYAPVGKAVSMPRGQYAQNFQSYSIHTQDVTRGLLSKPNSRAAGRYNFGGNKWTV